MKLLLACLCIALSLSAAPASGQQREKTWRVFPGVSNTSYVEPNGNRALQLSIDVPASQRQVFDAFATTEGFTSWAVPVAKVDLRVGGSIESNYRAGAPLGTRDNIRNAIVAYVPDRLIVLQNVQAPPTFVHPELYQRTVTIIEIVALDAGHSRVTITNPGYGPGPDFDRIYRQFEYGNAYSLAGLRRRFEVGPVDWSKGEPKLEANTAVKSFEGER